MRQTGPATRNRARTNRDCGTPGEYSGPALYFAALQIVFVSHYALPHVGGIEVVVDRIARELTARGHSVTHVTSASLRPGELPLRDSPPYKVVRLPALNILERRAGLPYPIFEPVSLVRTLRRACRTADVVHAHGMLYASSAAALLLARRSSDAVRVLTEHAGMIRYSRATLNVIEKTAIRTIGRTTVRAAEGIVVVGTRVEKEMQDVARVPVVRIENGVDVDRFRPADAGERRRLRQELGWDEQPRVLFVGRIVERKGAPLAIAAARLAGTFRLAIAGPGVADDANNNFDHLGAPDDDTLAKIYRAADAFLLPSHGEGGFPLTAREAMASGLPVILRDDPTYRAALDPAPAGVRFVPPEPRAIAEAVADVLALGAAARDEVAAYAREHFRWSRTVDEHLRFYERLRAQRRP
jgi:glycosyltransferase involved in cell wall biosynthesis